MFDQAVANPPSEHDDAKPRRAARLVLARPWLVPTLAATALVASIYFVSPNYRWESSDRTSSDRESGVRQGPYAGDFLQEWLGGRVVLQGDRGRLYDPAYAKALQHDRQFVGFEYDSKKYLPLVYPPFYFAAVSPLSRLPYRTAAWIWSVLMCAAFAGGIAIAVKYGHRGRNAAPAWAWWAIPTAAMFAPLLESLNSGQKGTVCLLLLSATFTLLSRKRPLAAGLIFGLLAFKPQLVLVIAIAMLLKRQWPFVAGGAICGVALLAASLAVGGETCLQYLEFSTGAADYIQTAGYDLAESHCLYGFFSLLLPSIPAKVATIVVGAAVALLLGAILRGPVDYTSPRFELQFSAMTIATVLFSPHLYTYDLTILLLPLFLIGRRLIADNLWTRQRQSLAALVAAIYLTSALSPRIAAATGVQLSTLLLVATLVAIYQLATSLLRASGDRASGDIQLQMPLCASGAPPL